jgi:hypothetical protein
MENVQTSKVIDDVKVEIVTEYNFGADLNEAVSLFGESLVYEYFKANATVRLQAFVRTRIEAGKTADEIQEEANQWKPGEVKRSSKDPKEEIAKQFAKLSPEQQAAYLDSLRAQLGM